MKVLVGQSALRGGITKGVRGRDMVYHNPPAHSNVMGMWQRFRKLLFVGDKREEQRSLGIVFLRK
jgi:hypothetical protein